MPKISVVIPVYNTSKYLRQCLDSLISQTLQDFEVICVNDGSKDNSLEILNEYVQKDSRFIVIDKENEGQGVARNLAIQKAQGEFLLCLDSDDWLEDNALELAYNKILEDSADIIFFDIYRYSEKTKQKCIYKYTGVYSKFQNTPFTKEDAGETIFKTNGLTFKMYKTKLIQDNDIKYSNHKFHEDVPFYFGSVLCSNRLTCLSEPIYNYRIFPKSSSYNYKQYFTCIPEVFEICFDLIEQKNPPNEIIASFLGNRYRSLIGFYNLTPTLYKPKYYKMMQKIIKKYFLRYDLDKDLENSVQNILKNNFLQHCLTKKIKATKIVLKTYKI